MKRHTRQLGISTSNVVGILACASIGAWVGGFLLTVVGVEVFQPQIRFLAFMVQLLSSTRLDAVSGSKEAERS